MEKNNSMNSHEKNGIQKIQKNKAASWCCEASTAVDIKEMIKAIKKES